MARRPGPTEHQFQKNIIHWATLFGGAYPELDFLFHVPNGFLTKRRMGEAKAVGLKAGCPDLWLPVARRGWHGLVIELKRPGEKPRANQVVWLEFLFKENYLAVMCEGDEDAIHLLGWYIGLREDEPDDVYDNR